MRPSRPSVQTSEQKVTKVAKERKDEMIRLIELLMDELGLPDQVATDVAQLAFPIWSPYDAYEGAATLMRVLAEDCHNSEDARS